MDKTNWQEIQKDELKYHLLKNKDRIMEYNIPYWKSLLDEIEAHEDDEDKVAELLAYRFEIARNQGFDVVIEGPAEIGHA